MKKILIILLLVISCQKNEQKVYPPDSLGLWTIKYFKNEYQKMTDVGYITNLDPIKGTFGNSKVKSGSVNIKVMVKEDAIAFKLYEFDSKNAVKGNKQDAIEYALKIEHNGELVDYIFKAYNETDVVVIGNIISSDHEKELIKYLKMGGLIKFSLKEKNNNKSTYSFEIINEPTFGFNNAMEKIISR